MFIESNSTGTGGLFTTIARERGYRPIILTDNPERYAFLDQHRIDFIRTNTSDSLSIRKVVADLSEAARIAGVYSSSEYFVEAAATLSDCLGLPGADCNAIRVCRNKWRQRLVLQAAGFSVPRFQLACSMRDVLSGVESIGLPCILKPTLGTGSIGVRLCTTVDEAEQHAALLLQRHKNERGMPVAAELLVEEYVRGPEYSVETFHRRVVGITRKYTTPEPYFVETGHDFPADLTHTIVENCGDSVTRALDAMGLSWGPAHTELRLSKDGIIIIEINPRLAGGFIPELVRLATGIDLISATLAATVGDEFDIEQQFNSNASIRFLIPKEEGVLTGLDGFDEVSQIPGVVDARLYYESGHACRIRRDFRDRLGHVISIGTVPGEAVTVAERALRHLRILMNSDLFN